MPSVTMTPGLTVFAVMPDPARCRARLVVMLTTAALAAEYVDQPPGHRGTDTAAAPRHHRPSSRKLQVHMRHARPRL
ncbi:MULTISPECIES: hypothetical protein [Streptomyces]|nr:MULTISPECIES: hypothetical protein [Streptomyces]